MKTVTRIIGRTLILLAAALVVVGALLAISRIDPQAQPADPRDEFERPEPGFRPGSDQSGELTGRQQGEFHHRFEGDGRGGPDGGHGEGRGEGRGGFILFSLVKNLGVIAIIVLLVQGAGRLGKRFTRRPAAA